MTGELEHDPPGHGRRPTISTIDLTPEDAVLPEWER